LSTENDYRAAVETINHIRWQDEQDTVKLRTLADSVVRGGTKLIDHTSKIAEDIFEKNNFDITTGRLINPMEIAAEPIEGSSIPHSEVVGVNGGTTWRNSRTPYRSALIWSVAMALQ